MTLEAKMPDRVFAALVFGSIGASALLIAAMLHAAN
jgi:hypothetical protein